MGVALASENVRPKMHFPSSHLGHHLTRLSVAALLLTAASAKGYQLATEPIPAAASLSARWLHIAGVELELLLGLCLIARLYLATIWRITAVLFTAFAAVSLAKAISGQASCGCFGRVVVSPWVMLLVDFAVLTALFRWPPPRWECEWTMETHHSMPNTMRAAVVMAVFALFGLPGAFLMASYEPSTLSPHGEIIGQDTVVVLEPEGWHGKRFPLLDHIDIGEHLKVGTWVVLLYHHDCPKCQDVIPAYLERARDLSASANAPRIALIDVPKYGPPVITSRGNPVYGRLNNKREWFVQTPVEIILRDGIVVRTSTTLDWLRSGRGT